ncbi:MAG: hypothetical protein AAFX39_16030 [Pseudomonadota bacterium]
MSSVLWIARGIIAAALIGTAVLFYVSQTDVPSEADKATNGMADTTPDTATSPSRAPALDIPPDFEIGALETNRARRDVTPEGVTPAPEIAWPVERAPSLEPPPAPEPTPEPARFFRVGVVDAGMIATQRDYTVSFAHITALGADQTCTDGTDHDWPCGRAARHALMRLIRGRAVTCDIAPDELASRVAEEIDLSLICSVGGFEINHWLIEHGWATARAGAPELYHEAEELARAEARGQWSEDWRNR